MKYFYFNCNSFFGTFILVFPYHGDVVLLFRENWFLILSFSKSENTQNIPTIPTFLDLNSYRLSSGPYFSYYSYFSLLLICVPTFPYFFSEIALLSLLFSPKMFEVTKNCNFFPRSLEVCKNWINLI